MVVISCLMVTLERQEEFLRSLDCYCAQTYTAKELVIVCDGNSSYRDFVTVAVHKRHREDVSILFVDPGLTLGALRNLSVQHATGDVVCQWDDDDVYHPERLATQMLVQNRVGADASFLSDHLHMFEDVGNIYLLDWRTKPGVPGESLHPGTMMAYKRILPLYDETLRQTEDLQLSQTILRSRVRVALISGLGHLYIYTYHGLNTYKRGHHEWLVSCCALRAEDLINKLSRLKKEITRYGISSALNLTARAGLVMVDVAANSDDSTINDADLLTVRVVSPANGQQQTSMEQATIQGIMGNVLTPDVRVEHLSLILKTC